MTPRDTTASPRSILDTAVLASIVAMALLSLAAMTGLVGSSEAFAAAPVCSASLA